MIRSSASLMADDVSIRCKVRRSKLQTNPDYQDAQEVQVIMRNWEPRHHGKKRNNISFTSRNNNLGSTTASSNPDKKTIQLVEGDDHHYGPELLLTPVREMLTNRERSASPRQRRRQVTPTVVAPTLAAYSVPIHDIVVVETCNNVRSTAAHKIQVTTLSMGYFDFDCISRNGHDILLAFLQASLPTERILDGRITDTEHPGIRKTSSSMSCLDMDLDVDALTAQHLKGEVDRETWLEKISRRTGKVVSSLSEMSETFCETIVCCQVDRESADDIRDSPPRHARESHLELDEGSNLYSADLDDAFEKRQSKLMLKNCHLPSGLSVEPDPEMVSARY